MPGSVAPGLETATILNESRSDPPPLSPVSLLPNSSGLDGLDVSPLASVNVGLPSPEPVDVSTQLNLSKDSCTCLKTVGLLMIELEAKTLVVDTAALDAKLASQKEFLGRCDSVLGCPDCSARPEYLLLLGLLTQNLANACEATVNKYIEDVQSLSMSPQSPDATHNSLTSSKTNSRAHLGHYEVESTREWSTLMKVLIILQLQSVQTLLRGMKKASHMASNAMLPRVEWPCPTERRVIGLIQRLGQIA